MGRLRGAGGWYFDLKGSFTNRAYLKDNVMAALNSQEGREMLKGVGKEKASLLLKDKVLLDADPEDVADAFINFFSKDENFNLIFK